MEYRALGKTGLQVSRLSYGASALGGVFGAVTQREADDVVRVALDSGVNLLDVAPFYGQTRAETVLGEALRGIPRERYILSTKVGRYGREEFDFSAARVVRSVEESLKRLHTDYADIIICHDIEYVPLRQVIEEAAPALRQLQAQGKARFLAVSGLPLTIYPPTLAQTDLDLILSYCHYTLQNTALAELTPTFREKGLGVISAAPLSMGLLTNQGPPDWHPATEAIKMACAAAAAHCRARHADLAKLGIQFALATDAVDTTMVGTANAEELRRNIAWMEEPIEAELLAEVQAILAPVHNQMWASGLPEYA